MAHVILVHGMSSNVHSWFDVPNMLEKKVSGGGGHDVHALTLPGHDGTPDPSTVTMQDYIDAVEEKMPSAASGEKCTLIGHSLGGAVASHVAEQHHDRIERLIFVAAMLPKHNESAQDIIGRAGSGPAEVMALFERHFPQAAQAIGKQPPQPLTARFNKTAAYDALERHYILCEQDKILPAALQRKMIKYSRNNGAPISADVALDSDHLPQITMPDELVKHMNAMIG